MTLKQSQGHQTYNDNVDPKQGKNHAKFERPPLKSICQKANIKVFVKSENVSTISCEYVQKWKIVAHSLPTWQSYKVSTELD